MKKITTNELESKLQLEHFSLKFDDTLFYYCINLSKDHQMFVIRDRESISNKKLNNIVTSGQLIAEVIDDQILLLPSFLSIITNTLPKLNLSPKKMKKITFGKVIKTEEDHRGQLFMVKDKYDRNIALVFKKESNLRPIIDIGSWLRFEGLD